MKRPGYHSTLPPQHWMASEHAIALRTQELQQQRQGSPEQCRAQAEAEFRAIRKFAATRLPQA